MLAPVDFKNWPWAVGNFLVRPGLPLPFSCSTLIFSVRRTSAVLSTKGFNNVPLNESYLIDSVISFVALDSFSKPFLRSGFFLVATCLHYSLFIRISVGTGRAVTVK